jgi:hypothetical protein
MEFAEHLEAQFEDTDAGKRYQRQHQQQDPQGQQIPPAHDLGKQQGTYAAGKQAPTAGSEQMLRK